MRVGVKLAIALALLAILWSYTPPAHPAFQLCGYHWLTGRPCPFCGLTRAAFALAKGHWSDAIHFNALSPLAFAMAIGLFWNFGAARDRLWTYGLAAFAIYGTLRIFLPGV